MQRIEEIAAEALKKMNNDRYKLSLVVAKRAEELANGATALVNIAEIAKGGKMKFADIALYEIAQEKITLEGGIESGR